MPKIRLPLVGSMSTRNVDAVTVLASKDQIFSGVMFDVIKNPVTGKGSVFAFKRPGLKSGTTIATSKTACGMCDPYGFNDITSTCTAWTVGGSTNEEIYVGTTSCGVTSGTGTSHRFDITKAIIAGEETYLLSNVRGCYFINETGLSGTTTFTGDFSSGTNTILNASSTTGLVVGQYINATSYTAASGTRITNISGSTITMQDNAIGTAAGITVTRERMAKFIAANFPSSVIGPMWEMDGYVFAAEQGSQKIYHSDLNTAQTWTSTNFVSANATPGQLLGISRLGQFIVAHTPDSMQYFYNAGNAVGSVLSRVQNKTIHVGGLVRGGSFWAGASLVRPFTVLDDNLFVVSNSIYQVATDGSMKRISTDIVDRLIANTAASSINIQAMYFLGKPYVFLSDGSTVITYSLMYDVSLGLWSHTGFTAVPIFSKNMGYCQNTTLFSGRLDTWPWTSDGGTPTYQDNGSTLTTTIQTGRLDFGSSQRTHITRIDLIGDKQASGTVTLTSSDNDFASFATLGTFDLTAMNPRIYRCGHFVGGRSLKLTHTTNAAFRAEALDIYYEDAEEMA